MNILIIGKGAREHALAWKIKQSPIVEAIYIDNGNGGTQSVGENVEIEENKIIQWCKNNDIGLVVVGPEMPLVEGIGDELKKAGILAVAPSKYAAQLEGSKKFTKDMCNKMNVPTAKYQSCENIKQAKEYMKKNDRFPIVVKWDGLAGGKGVIIAENREEAETAIVAGFENGETVVVEEFLEGTEASMFFLCDGEIAMPLATAQDYKRIRDNDQGPNTGGMGAISPAPALTAEIEEKVKSKIIKPTMEFMKNNAEPFCGILYAGLMIKEQEPYLIEYNVRFGDPECQAIMMKMESDIVPLLIACAKGELDKTKPVEWYHGNIMTLVMAGEKYPETSSETPQVIVGLDKVDDTDVVVFHGNTKKEKEKMMALGGRVLAITARGKNKEEVRKKIYDNAKRIEWGTQFYRKDIGL